MGNGMDKVMPGIYIGNIRDSKDAVQLKDNGITHILSIHDNAKKIHQDMKYLCINASDTSSQDLSQYFPMTNDFIHQARLSGGNVLIHCLAGVSRSVTVTIAYIMTVTNLGWRDALKVCRQGRNCANPNFGFQRQLLAFEHEKCEQERARVKRTYPPSPYDDHQEARKQLDAWNDWVYNGDHESGSKPEGATAAAAATSADIYPLPHKAYGERAKAANELSSTESKTVQNEDALNENESLPQNQNAELSSVKQPSQNECHGPECETKGKTDEDDSVNENSSFDSRDSQKSSPGIGATDDTQAKIDDIFANN